MPLGRRPKARQVNLVQTPAIRRRHESFVHPEHLPLLKERFPGWAEKVEFWHVDDGPEGLAATGQRLGAG
jgi:hypothetical protein